LLTHRELERLVLDNAFDHGDHPILRQHAKVCAIDTDPAGNIKPSKAAASQRIDGVAAGCMAIGIALRDTDEVGESVYEQMARERAEAA